MFDVGQAGEVPAKSCPQPFDGEVPAKSLRNFGGKKQWRSSRHNIFRRSSFNLLLLLASGLFIGYHTPSILAEGPRAPARAFWPTPQQPDNHG